MNQFLTTIQIIASRHCKIPLGRFVERSIVAIYNRAALYIKRISQNALCTPLSPKGDEPAHNIRNIYMYLPMMVLMKVVG